MNKKLRESWLNSPAKFKEDTLTIKGFQVMQKWEESYMKKLSSIVTKNGGRILEVGFGLGISAEYIQKSPEVKSHVIIECHLDIIQFACKKFKKEIASGGVIIVDGFWQDVVPNLKDSRFDGILFDSIAIDEEPHKFNSFPFFKEAHRLLKEGGVFTYFSDEAKKISKKHLEKLKNAGFSDISYSVCEVNPPEDCKYWKDDTIVAPIVIK